MLFIHHSPSNRDEYGNQYNIITITSIVIGRNSIQATTKMSSLIGWMSFSVIAPRLPKWLLKMSHSSIQMLT